MLKEQKQFSCNVEDRTKIQHLVLQYLRHLAIVCQDNCSNLYGGSVKCILNYKKLPYNLNLFDSRVALEFQIDV